MIATSPTGTPPFLIVLPIVISFLAALVSIAAVLVARSNVQRQITATARQNWMREFREQVAGFLGSFATYTEKALWFAEFHQPGSARSSEDVAATDRERHEANDEMRRHFHVIRLLIAEQGPQHDATFIPAIERLLQAPAQQVSARAEELTSVAERILQRERAAIDAAPEGRRLRLRRWLGAVEMWPTWSRFVAWCRGRPRWPT